MPMLGKYVQLAPVPAGIAAAFLATYGMFAMGAPWYTALITATACALWAAMITDLCVMALTVFIMNTNIINTSMRHISIAMSADSEQKSANDKGGAHIDN